MKFIIRFARFVQSASNSPMRLMLRVLRLRHGNGCFFHQSVKWSLATLDRIHIGSLLGISKLFALALKLLPCSASSFLESRFGFLLRWNIANTYEDFPNKKHLNKKSLRTQGAEGSCSTASVKESEPSSPS